MASCTDLRPRNAEMHLHCAEVSFRIFELGCLSCERLRKPSAITFRLCHILARGKGSTAAATAQSPSVRLCFHRDLCGWFRRAHRTCRTSCIGLCLFWRFRKHLSGCFHRDLCGWFGRAIGLLGRHRTCRLVGRRRGRRGGGGRSSLRRW
jgi:hypothetical protein